jgi:hypothetical protein
MIGEHLFISYPIYLMAFFEEEFHNLDPKAFLQESQKYIKILHQNHKISRSSILKLIFTLQAIDRDNFCIFSEKKIQITQTET